MVPTEASKKVSGGRLGSLEDPWRAPGPPRRSPGPPGNLPGDPWDAPPCRPGTSRGPPRDPQGPPRDPESPPGDPQGLRGTPSDPQNDAKPVLVTCVTSPVTNQPTITMEARSLKELPKPLLGPPETSRVSPEDASMAGRKSERSADGLNFTSGAQQRV